MIVELKNEPMTDLVLLEKVNIETQNPDVQDENGDSAPRWEIPWECCTFALNAQIFVYDNEDKSGQ